MFRRWEGAEMGLEFTAENHEYKYDGVQIPSVTQIIKDAGLVNFNFISDELLEAKADLGNKVHKSLEFLDKGILNIDELHPKLKSYLPGWEKFKKDFSFVIEENELIMYHPTLRYAGTIDRVGLVNGSRSIIDIKTGIAIKSHCIQTSGYAELYNYSKPKEKHIKRRLAVYLTPENYKVIEHKESSDRNIFLAALTIANYHKRSNK